MRAVLLLVIVWTGLAAAARDAWEPVGLCGGGSMYALGWSPHDPDVLRLSCDMGGAYVSRDAGRSWSMLDFRRLGGYTRCPPAWHPSRDGVVYAFSGWAGRLRVSADMGETWRAVGGRPPWRGRPVLLWIDPDRGETVFVGAEESLHLSADGGRSWHACAGVTGSPLGMCALRERRTRDPGERAFVLATEAGVFRSEDGGRGFVATAAQPGERLVAFAGGSDGGESRLYASVPTAVRGDELVGGIFVSADGGASWESCMGGGINLQTRRSSEWAHGDLPRYPHLATTDAAPLRVWAYCSGTSYFPPDHATVYRSDDAGRTWRAVLFSDPRFKACNAGDDWLTTAIGQRYQEIPNTFAVSPADPDRVAMAGSMFALVTTDGGRSWRPAHVGERRRPRGVEQAAWGNNGLVVTSTWHYRICPHRPRVHFICYTDVGLARSVDGGEHWTWLGHRLPWRNTCYDLAFDPAVPGRLWGAFSDTHDIPNGNIVMGRHAVRMAGGVALSTDYGESWTAVDLPAAPALAVVLDPDSPPGDRVLYASLFERGVYKSVDGGKTWRARNRGLGDPANRRCCRLDLHADGTLHVLVTAKRRGEEFAATGVGLYRSADGGDSWHRISAGLDVLWPKDFAVAPGDSDVILLGAADARPRRDGGLWATRDGGTTWKRILREGPQHFGAAFHPERPGWIYATLAEGAPEHGLYLSRDGGRSFAPFPGLPFANAQRVAFDPRDEDRIHVTTFGGSVWRGPAVPSGD